MRVHSMDCSVTTRCLSVTHQYSVDTSEHILKFFCRQITPLATTLVFFHIKRDSNTPMGTPLTGALNARGYQKNYDFRPMSRFVSEMMQDRATVIMEGE